MTAPDLSSSSRSRDLIFGALLFVATFLAYQPAWNGQPIWDDAAHLTPPVRRPVAGLIHTWTQPGETQQYYPIVHTAFWLEDKLWGQSMIGYHLTNIFLHLAIALLLMKTLRLLEIPAAWLAAAVFALHPIEVESVAWITELKNTLSGLCYFGAGLLYFRFERTRSKWAYALALAIFLTGLLAKTVIATLPAALLIVVWWKRGRISWKQHFLPMLPFFAVGLAAGLFTEWMERHFIGAKGAAYNFSIIERCLIAGRAFWFYLGKLFWPANLIFSYPRWKISGAEAWQYLYPLFAIAAMVALWLAARRHRGPFAAMAFYVVTLFPALGFVNVFPFKYSFVADHFQYLAGIGPIIIGCMVFWDFFRRCKTRLAGSAVLLSVLAILTWHQCHIYTDLETLWRDTVARNPESWLARNDLGAILYEKGDAGAAIPLFQSALALEPENSDAWNNLGAALDKLGRDDEAADAYEKALTLRPYFAEAHRNLGDILLRKGRLDDAIAEYQKAVELRPDLVKPHFSLGLALLQKHKPAEAAAQFEQVARLQPDFAEGQNNLGFSLCEEGRVDEAIVHLRKALEIDPGFGRAHYNLGNALMKKGQLDEAIAEFEKVLALQPGVAAAENNLGKALLEKGRAREAIGHFEKALAIQPNLEEARQNLARAKGAR